jgi:hypothetical protein
MAAPHEQPASNNSSAAEATSQSAPSEADGIYHPFISVDHVVANSSRRGHICGNNDKPYMGDSLLNLF